MEWWQIVLIILAAVVAGLLVGGLASHLITLALNKSSASKRKAGAVPAEQPPAVKPKPVQQIFNKASSKEAEKPETKATEQPQPIPYPVKETPELTPELTSDLTPELTPETITEPAPEEKPEPAKAATEEPSFSAPQLLAEIEINYRIASEPPPATGNLAPFETSTWDASRDGIHNLPVNLHDDLAQAYVDMRLANSIVWLSVELGRRSPNLDESYTKLCTNIASRLNRISPQLKQLGEK